MGEGQILPVHMLFQFFSHTWGCPPNSNTFLNLLMNAHGYIKSGAPDGTLPDIYIQRVGNVWTAYVNTAFDNPDYQDLTKFDSTSANFPSTTIDNILGQYATCPPSGKGKKPVAATYHYPWAKAHLQFKIAFTKN